MPGFFDEISSFFGMGDKKDEGPITVPLPYDEKKAANDPAVQAAEAKYSAAQQREDEVKAREDNDKQLAEGRQSEDWIKKYDQAKAEHDRLKAQYEGARTKAQGGDLYDDQKQELYQRYTVAYQKMKAVENRNDFARANPLSKYLDPAIQAELKAAGIARMQAYNELDAAKRATARPR
jgi:hypothetical protein